MKTRATVCLASFAVAAAALSGCTIYTTPTVQPDPYPAPAARPAPPDEPPPIAPPPAAAPVYRPVSDEVRVDYGYFYDALEPDGDWLWLDPYGWVWAPNAVDPFWRPYTVGHWEWTDWGWTWVSAERWGWATYHYGRWARANRYGWVWVPGNVWGPAWVAWRSGTGVVGWAPLPPAAGYRAGVGLDWGGTSVNVAIRVDNWCFLDVQRFVEPDVHRYAYPVGRNATVVRLTRDVTKIHVVDKRIVNEGVDRDDIARATRRPIYAKRVVDAPRHEPRPADVTGEQVRVFRPEVNPAAPHAVPRHGIKPAPSARVDDREISHAPLPHTDSPPADEAERRWKQRWIEDRQKLQQAQRRPAAPAVPSASNAPATANAPAVSATPATPNPQFTPSAPAAPSAPATPSADASKQQREENAVAEANAKRELLAERERAQRRADRFARRATPANEHGPKPKTDDKEKKDKTDTSDEKDDGGGSQH